MNYQTELMNEILTNKKAQEIIDYVSQVYGQSYVGLWLFQAIGTVLGQVYDMSANLRYETSPATATMLLAYWEQEYNLPRDPTLTTEQRRARIITAMRSRGACTPERLAAAVSSALGGAPVEVFERTGVNQFTVSIRTAVKSLQPAINVIDRMKPAHLTYLIHGVTQENVSTDVTVATAMTRGIIYSMHVQGPETTSGLVVINNTLKRAVYNSGTGQTTYYDISSTNDGNGTTTIGSLHSTDDGNGTVTLRE
jgi:hypothetical protein